MEKRDSALAIFSMAALSLLPSVAEVFSTFAPVVVAESLALPALAASSAMAGTDSPQARRPNNLSSG